MAIRMKKLLLRVLSVFELSMLVSSRFLPSRFESTGIAQINVSSTKIHWFETTTLRSQGEVTSYEIFANVKCWNYSLRHQCSQHWDLRGWLGIFLGITVVNKLLFYVINNLPICSFCIIFNSNILYALKNSSAISSFISITGISMASSTHFFSSTKAVS